MRRIATGALIAGAALTAAADDSAPAAAPAAAAGRTVAEGAFSDEYWSLRYELAGLAQTGGLRAPRIFAGEAGAVAVEILVTENDRVTSAAEVRDRDATLRIARRLELRDAASGDTPAPWSAFTDRDLTGRDVRHRCGYHAARGLQVFAVHAWAPAGDGADDALARAVSALRLGEDRGATLLAHAFAIDRKRPADSIEVLCLAADAYLRKRDESGLDNPPLAAIALQQAVVRLSVPGTTPDQVYGVSERMGLTLLVQRKIEPAIEWLEKAAEAAAKSSDPDTNAATSHYNIACGHALAGRADEAFAALDRAFAKVRPVDDAYLRKDADLESLRTDLRWPAVLARARPSATKK